jgi:hypothetical protein
VTAAATSVAFIGGEDEQRRGRLVRQLLGSAFLQHAVDRSVLVRADHE